MLENSTMESINDINLEVEVTDILRKANVPANVKGFNYLRTAIMLSVKNVEMINSVTKLLYPTVAERHQAKPTQVERAIRHAIEIAWDRGARENLLYITSFDIGVNKPKPSNSEFIAAIADYLRLELKRKRGDNSAR